jgi:putative flippase GtrA
MITTEIKYSIMFFIVSVSATLVDLLLFFLLYQQAEFQPTIANIFSFCTATLMSFELNRRWTFRSSEISFTPKALGSYYLTAASSLAISTFAIWGLHSLIGAVWAKLLSLPATFVWNYTWSRFKVFSSSKAG